MLKYSEVKERLHFSEKRKFKLEAAAVTHYMQSNGEGSGDYYQQEAEDYLNTLKEPEFNYEIQFEYDVPFPPIMNPDFTFIDLFAGIGGFRLALQELNGKCVFSSEWDKSAQKTYEANFGEVPFGDITIIDEKKIPDHDILVGGFPCQPFSLAGVSARNSLGMAHGFDDKKQGNLFFDIVRIVKEKKPKVLFLENVKNFQRHDGGATFRTVESTIENLGYSFHYRVINSQTVVPQKRQRFYMVCFKDSAIEFEFPELEGDPIPLRSILELNPSEEYTISDKLWAGHIRRTKNNLERGTGFTAFEANLDKPANTLVARYGKDGKECLVPQKNKNPRKLTPRECARLQGFPESFKLPKSNAPAYRQFGNSVAVPVIKAISLKIVAALNQQKK